MRYSVVRWLPSTTENAVGPHIHDPRSGEILEADVQFYHNVQNLGKNWYFVQAGPNDPRAQQLPLPDDLMGELIRYVVAHEVGHTLGFQHNMKASSTYTIEQIRDPKWVKENSHTPTLMDYSRFNYVAQPEDRIAPADLIPKIGPYDKWATMWGYKPIPGAKTPEAEKPTLDRVGARAGHQAVPALLDRRPGRHRSGRQHGGRRRRRRRHGHHARAYAIWRKVSESLMKATTYKTGKPWDELEEVYGRMAGQWTTEMNHVVEVIGGVDSQQKHIGQNGVRFVTVAEGASGRRAAVPAGERVHDAVVDRAPGHPAPDPADRHRRSRADGAGRHHGAVAAGAAAGPDGRAVRARRSHGAYSPLQFLMDLRAGSGRSLRSQARRSTSIAATCIARISTPWTARLNGAASEEVRAMVKGELRALDAQLQVRAGSPATTDDPTKRHLQDCRDEIAAMLDPLVPRGGRAGGPAAGRTRRRSRGTMKTLLRSSRRSSKVIRVNHRSSTFKLDL